jgi:hypothetical protein
MDTVRQDLVRNFGKRRFGSVEVCFTLGKKSPCRRVTNATNSGYEDRSSS